MKLIIAQHHISCEENGAPCHQQTGILIEKNQIHQIGPLADFRQYQNDGKTQIIDAGQHYVMPGLIDAHLHLCFDSSENPILSLETESQQTTLLKMAASAQLELKSGVTTIRDCGAKGFSIMELKRAIDCGIFTGPNIICCGPPITITGGHCHFLGLEADSYEKVLKWVRLLCKNQVDFIKVMVSGGNMTPGSNSLINQYDRKILEMIVYEAHTRGKKVAGHIHTMEGISFAIDAGFDTIEHCSFLGVQDNTDQAYFKEMILRIKEKQIAVCPAMGKSYILSPEEGAPLPERIPMWRRFQASRFETTRSMYKEDVSIIAGTDAGCKHSYFDEFYLTLKLMEEKIGMSREDVLLSATKKAAKAIGLPHLGSLEVGNTADLIFVDGNPLEDLTALGRVCTIIKGGQVLG